MPSKLTHKRRRVHCDCWAGTDELFAIQHSQHCSLYKRFGPERVDRFWTLEPRLLTRLWLRWIRRVK